MNPVVIYLLAGFLCGTFAGTWKPFLGLHKSPPTAEVTRLQADLVASQADAQVAVQLEKQARAAERAGLVAQVKAAQADGFGAEIPLTRVSNPSPEVILGLRMINRANVKLALAIGKMPQDEQNDMVELIDQLLSGKQAEIDAANAKLAKADADFKAVTAQRDQIAAQIPVLTQKAQESEKKAAAVQSAYNGAVDEVNVWAAKKDAADKKAGSLLGSLSTLKNWGIGIFCAWVFLAFVIPGIIKHLDAGWLKTGLRHVAGFATSPLLYLDATKKIPNTNLPPTP